MWICISLYRNIKNITVKSGRILQTMWRHVSKCLHDQKYLKTATNVFCNFNLAIPMQTNSNGKTKDDTMYRFVQGCSFTFQNEGVAQGLKRADQDSKMVALNRPLYKVSFHGGGGLKGVWLLTGGLTAPWLHPWFCYLTCHRLRVSQIYYTYGMWYLYAGTVITSLCSMCILDPNKSSSH